LCDVVMERRVLGVVRAGDRGMWFLHEEVC
jgi:hypothetical protein